ncbi:MAG TPA: S8 family serine peptidase [Rubrivivax sp.]
MTFVARRLHRFLLLAALVCAPALADRERSLAPPPVDDVHAARVIVSYRNDARLLRDHPLQRGQSRAFVDGVYQRRADAIGSRAGLALRAGRAVGDRAHVLTARGIASAALAARLAADPDLEYAVVDRRRRALAVNDPLFSAGPASGRGPDVGQWYLRAPGDLFRSAANIEAAWNAGSNGSGVVVAVLDTGVLYGHVDLQGQLLAGHDFITDADDANDGDGRDTNAADPGDWCDGDDSSWHGTQVAGIIAAATNNGLGMAGAAPGARILPVRVLGKCGGFDSDIAAGMLWAAGVDQAGLPGSTTPARVLNLSLGGDSGVACSRVYIDAAAAVNARGAVVVAAAGNSAGRATGSPANCPGVIGVAGLRHAGSKVGFSDLGADIAIAAPGGNCVNVGGGEPCLYPILTTSNSGLRGPDAGGSIYTDSYNASVGTSFAAPIVAATAALMLSARPQLGPAEVLQALKTSARAFPTSGADNGVGAPAVEMCVAPGAMDQLQCYCTSTLCGAGMLDAAAAVSVVSTGLFARIDVTPGAPVVGETLQLSGAGSLPAAGRSVVSYAWELVSGGGSVSAFAGATDAASATLQPAAPGTVVVRLTVTDDLGAESSFGRSIVVAAAPVVEPPAPEPVDRGGGGGGAFSMGWILLLALASALLCRRRR